MSTRLDLPTLAWHRVSPKYLTAEFIGLAVTALVVAGATIPLHLFGWDYAWWATAAAVLAVLVYAAFTPRRIRAIGYVLRDDDLVFRKGILFQRFVAVPYGRMQLIDVNRGPLLRALGLSDLKFVTAAASTNVIIPGLPQHEADELRDHLVALAESRRAGL
ncbi:PH domain-containing protein [Marisediminicola senii]|uniref:PH domain-containing protein n=1 Tax=Marisediminicola senii TaxID=2711233 RepID=UPI0013EA05D3|nr:PH domain-containing protein [Marisediminicola senii]